MKRSVTAALLALLLMLNLTACGSKEQPTGPSTGDVDTLPSALPDVTDDPTDYAALLSVPFADLNETPADQFSYREEAGRVTITSYTGSNGKVRIPKSINGSPVTALADGAFRNQSDVTVLYIPDSVTDFGKELLVGCDQIYALRTPLPQQEGTAYLGYLFGAPKPEMNNMQDMRNLEFLQLGGSAEQLPAYALYDCNDLVAIELPSSMRELGDFSLYHCESLKYINTEQLRKIGTHAMDSCLELTELVLGSEVTEIGLGALENCKSLRRMTLPFVGGSREQNRYLGYVFGAADPAFSAGFYPAGLRQVKLLSGCTSIGAYAFYACDSLLSVDLCEGIAEIGVRAFSGCIRLGSVALPNSLTSIRENAFVDCVLLTEIRFGTGLTAIGVNAFSGCRSLTSVSLPSGLTVLPNSCFAGCTALQTVELGGVTSVGIKAFYRCTALQSVKASAAVDFADGNEAAEACLKS